ncbi:AraC family transcriptional regulator [Rhizorhabdus wittichii DC-6]|nr:AraC family transcriptional regulator [Rhizorhabdus wittichii DC-6]
MTAIGLPDASGTRFTDYLETHSLPSDQADTRAARDGSVLATLVTHSPVEGGWFRPIDDLVISIVMQSCHSDVVRDIGWGRSSFVEAPGCILVTPPGCKSYWTFGGNPLVLHFSIARERLEALGLDWDSSLSDAGAGHLNAPLYDRLVSELASRIWSVLEQPAPLGERFVDHAVATMLTVLLGGHVEDRPASPARGGSGLPAWRMKKVRSLVAERPGLDLSIEELASSTGLSADHFVKAFSTTMGQTPHQWLSSLRIEEAKKLLRQTDQPLTEIALDLGFSSSAHFSSRFKQLVGMPPSAWRATFRS